MKTFYMEFNYTNKLHINMLITNEKSFPVASLIYFHVFQHSGTMALPGVFCRNGMMTSSNGNIFRVTGHLCGKFTDRRWIPHTKPVTRSFDVFFDLRLSKRLSKQWWGWWYLRCYRAHYDVTVMGRGRGPRSYYVMSMSNYNVYSCISNICLV